VGESARVLLDPPHCNLTGAGLTGWLHSSERFLLSLFGVTTASSRVRQTRRKKKRPANEWPALESFRRGCLKGTPFVQCNTVSRKCVEGHCDCKNCNCDSKAAFLGYEGVDKAPDPSRIAKDEISCFTG
jgi:hypothetical protein